MPFPPEAAHVRAVLVEVGLARRQSVFWRRAVCLVQSTQRLRQGWKQSLSSPDYLAGQNLAKPEIMARIPKRALAVFFTGQRQLSWILELDSAWMLTWILGILDYNPGIRLYVKPCERSESEID